MVCKKSLYCWKNGPCASDQTRKQIWEDNIRFRESLRDINQSDHYWSFQISKNLCLCLEGEEILHNRPLSRKYHSASLQRLPQFDCTSITHDFNSLKFRNCYVHCPTHNFSKTTNIKRADTPVPQSLAKKDFLTSLKYPLHKSDGEKPEYCHRYKNTLTSTLKPSMRTKFLSHTNLNSLHDDKSSLKKKTLHSSCENINLKTQEDIIQSPLEKIEKPKNENNISLVENKKTNNTVEVQKKEKKVKKSKKELNPIMKYPKLENFNEYTPMSRTTRKMLNEHKQIPFVTYGCNNSNLDIGSKKTHNVLASKLEVYPNALSAKQQKKNLILKYIQGEKEFQKKCIPEDLRKKLVNHSSLWSIDDIRKENKALQRKNTKYILPAMNKPQKKIIPISNQLDSKYFKTYRKPQIYFY